MPAAWRDPSEHPLTGQGSTLQHARSVYAQGPIEVLPGLFLGDEHNACDEQMLTEFGITTILNVSKETILPFQFDADAAPPLRGPLVGVSPSEPRTGNALLMSDGADGNLLSARFSASSSGRGASPHLVPPADLPQQVPYLRPHTSTPNLTRSYSQQSNASTSSSRAPQTKEPLDQIPSSPLEIDEQPAEGAQGGIPAVEIDIGPEGYPPLRALRDLPSSATALSIPPSAASTAAGKVRMHALQYIKLPWTHDEVDLATKAGGFRHGCALIAETLGLNVDEEGVPLDGKGAVPRGNGRILVHCQCGVSRSATLVIAFVMQAAALGYEYEVAKSLQGMHDCYNLVKE